MSTEEPGPPSGCHLPPSADPASPGTTAALADQLVHLRRTTGMLRAWVHGHAAPGVDPSPLVALHHLVVEGSRRPSVLAECLGVDQSTASRHVAALVRQGYAERVPDPADRRAALVRPTARGRQVHDDTRRLRCQVLADVLADWHPDDLADLTRALARLNGDIASRVPTSPPTPAAPSTRSST